MWAPLGRLLAYVRKNQIGDGANEFAADRESNCLDIGDSRWVKPKGLV